HRPGRARPRKVSRVVAREWIPGRDEREARHEPEHESAGVVGSANSRPGGPAEARREKNKERGRQDRERHGSEGLQDFDRLVPIDGDHHADRSDDENEAERQPAIDPSEQLRSAWWSPSMGTRRS